MKSPIGWMLYSLFLILAFISPFFVLVDGMRKVNRETYIYRWFPSWAKWIVESQDVFKR